MSGSEDDEVVESFSISLADLTADSKTHIDLLTKVAEKNVSQAGAIVKVVNDQLRKVPSLGKLPILYLIDSIVKNVGGDYVGLFPSILKQCFANIYKEADEMTRQSMCQLRRSWSDILSPKSLYHIDMQVHALDPDWLENVQSSQASKNTPPKILVNRNFFSSVCDLGNTGEDEAKILRELLLFQKKMRELEKERNAANMVPETDVGGLKESSGVVQCQIKTEKIVTTTISWDKAAAKSQADSTTSDGSSNLSGKVEKNNEENILATMVHADQKNSVHDKRAGGQLLNLLSELITHQNHKFTEQKGDKFPVHKYYSRHDKHRMDYRQTRRRSYECPKYPDDKFYRCYSRSCIKSYDRHHWYASSMDDSMKAGFTCTQKAKDCNCKSPMELTNRRNTDEPEPQCTQDFRNTSYQISQAPTPVRGEDLIHQLSVSNNQNKGSSHPKRKLELEGAENGPQIKTSCLNITSSSESSCSITSSEKEVLNFKNNLSNCQNKYKEALLSHATEGDLLVPLGFSNRIRTFQHFDSAGRRNTKNTKPTLLTPKPDRQTIEKSIEIRKEIDYNHGYGVPEKKYVDTCVEKHGNILNTTPQISQQPILPESGPHYFHESDDMRSARFSQKDIVNDTIVFLPPANQFVLEKISRDTMISIPVDKVNREIRYYGGTAIIGSGSDNPREVFFKPGEALIIINNIVVPCAFHKPDKEVVIDSKVFRVRLGAPTRECYVNDEGFQCAFNCSPIEVQLSSGEVLHVQLKSSAPPIVQIGAVRLDLVVGQVILGIDAMHYVRIFLDAKPQRFDISGIPHILKFADALRTILVNDRPVNMQFGGPPIPITVNGVKHFVSISELPPGIIPGQVNIASMACVRSELDVVPCSSYDNQNSHLVKGPLLQAAECKKPSKPSSRRTYWNGKVRLKKRTRAGVNLARALHQTKRLPRNEMNFTKTLPIGSAGNWDCSSAEASAYPGDSKNLSNVPTFKSNVNVHELFQSLCNVGLLKTQSSPERSKSPQEEIYEVDFKESSSLKWKQPKIVRTLYSGIQCSSCGIRFSSCNAESYREHLDLHFQQNHQLKDPGNHQRRSWYCYKKTWGQLGVPEVIPENKEVQMKSENLVNVVDCSVPSRDHPQGTVCEICREKFEEFFHHDKDEWHMKDCMSNEGVPYHPACFKDQNTVSHLNLTSRLCEVDACCKEDESLQHDDASISKPDELSGSQEQLTPLGDDDRCQPVEKALIDGTKQAEIIRHPEYFTTGGAGVQHGEENSLHDDAKELVAVNCEESIDFCDNKKLDNEAENLIQGECLNTKPDSGVILPLHSISTQPLSPCDTNNFLKEQDVDRIINAVELKCSSEGMETVILKPKLIGRKLVLLPPAIKGSETSNLCCVS